MQRWQRALPVSLSAFYDSCLLSECLTAGLASVFVLRAEPHATQNIWPWQWQHFFYIHSFAEPPHITGFHRIRPVLDERWRCRAARALFLSGSGLTQESALLQVSSRAAGTSSLTAAFMLWWHCIGTRKEAWEDMVLCVRFKVWDSSGVEPRGSLSEGDRRSWGHTRSTSMASQCSIFLLYIFSCFFLSDGCQWLQSLFSPVGCLQGYKQLVLTAEKEHPDITAKWRAHNGRWGG